MDRTINLFNKKGVALIPPENMEVVRKEGYVILKEVNVPSKEGEEVPAEDK